MHIIFIIHLNISCKQDATLLLDNCVLPKNKEIVIHNYG